MLKLWCLAILLSLFLQSDGKAPCSCGTVVRVKKEGIQYVSQSQRGRLHKEFTQIAIPEYSQKVQSGGGLLGGGLLGGGFLGGGILGSDGILSGKPLANIIGGVLKIAGISILNVDLPHIDVKLMPSVGLQITIGTGLHIKASIIHLTDVELKVASSILLDARISHTPKGFPIISVSACKTILGDIDVILGGHSLIPDILKILKQHIHKMLVDKLCLTVSNVFIGMNAELGLLGAVTPVDDQVNLQYTVPSEPVITDDYMDIDMDAQYTLNDQLIELPVSEEHFTLPSDAGQSDSMVNMGFSEDYFLSAFTAMQSSGALNMDITSQMFADQLTTSALGSYIPKVTALYPQSSPLFIKFLISKKPVVTLQTNKVVLDLFPSLEIFVISGKTARKSLLVLGAEVTLALKLDVSEAKIKATATLDGALQLQLVSSSISNCQCKASDLSGYMMSIFNKIIMANLNAQFGLGITLPAMPNMHLVKPVMDVTPEYAVMSCDLDYQQKM
ncbi:BPI fold-containing family B member 2 [Rhinatrema bivittatum]|uniref:BPI fold-containing family B member 2 n=1 Tax=Rhinatrema bivittatum TaxID=194408 RepID=UPI0011296391|nr:BPI fold-containing family B member 2 [Rhinatrema bivittatum]XP_029468484.1 BPI fold-containing family B member 2 [Rhinatrema bivittatum]XP_029468485.1 BPI fold-containing family B member 2 [Rhinatrema bivittatum]XP_029468486.1 BPI fold-containing family B member 2 [Rhinatrema bivittatum]